jgi:hypothetical protein
MLSLGLNRAFHDTRFQKLRLEVLVEADAKNSNLIVVIILTN